jgi:hypothetical protein
MHKSQSLLPHNRFCSSNKVLERGIETKEISSRVALALCPCPENKKVAYLKGRFFGDFLIFGRGLFHKTQLPLSHCPHPIRIMSLVLSSDNGELAQTDLAKD